MRTHITHVRDFAGLGEEWRALEATLPDRCFFQSWTWVGCLAEERFPDAVLLRAEADGRTLGLALFNRGRGRLCLTQSGDAALDAPFIEHNAPLATPAAAAALMRAAWDVPGVGRLVLGGVGPAVLAAAGGVAFRAQERAAPFVDLSALRGDPLGACSANSRQQIRRSERFYEATGPLRLRVARDPREALAFFEAMLPLHAATWQARGRPGAFATLFLRRFHHALIETGAPRGEVELLRIMAGEADVGILYNFRMGGRVHAYQSGLNQAGAGRHGKPGLTSHALAIGHALQTGERVYDFLAGADRYKLSLANASTGLHWVELVRTISRST